MDSKSTESPNDHRGLWGETFPVVIWGFFPQRPGRDMGQGTPQPSVCIELRRAEPGNGEKKGRTWHGIQGPRKTRTHSAIAKAGLAADQTQHKHTGH